MNRQWRRSGKIVPELMLLAMALGFGFMMLMAAQAQEFTDNPELSKRYTEAELLYKTQKDQHALQVLESIVADSSYATTTPAFKSRVHVLFAVIYYTMHEVDSLRRHIFKIYESDLNFDFSLYPDAQPFSELAESIRDSIEAASVQPLLFSFDLDYDPADTVHVKVGKTKTLSLRTVPDSVAVSFSLPYSLPGVSLEQTSPTTAELSFKPAQSNLNEIALVSVTAVSADTSQSVNLTFRVDEKGSRKLLYYIGGGALATTAAILLWPNPEPEPEPLPAFPNPPTQEGGGQ